MHLVVGNRAMLRLVRDDDELPWLDHDLAVSELHAQRAPQDEEEFVFHLVRVPHELALELHQLDEEVVYRTDRLGTPQFLEMSQLVGQVDFLHRAAPATMPPFVSNRPLGTLRHAVGGLGDYSGAAMFTSIQ